MKLPLTRFVLFAPVFVLFAFASAVFAQTTAFTYQGRLLDGATPASGTYNMQFTLHSAVSGMGNQVGTTITDTNVQVVNGLFTVTLDFGYQFPGTDRWLDVSVKKPADMSYSALTPRQKIASVPYAVTARGLNAERTSTATDPVNFPAATSLGTDSVIDIAGNYTDTQPAPVARQGRFRVNHDGSLLAKGDPIGNGSSFLEEYGVPVSSFGTRLMWHARKGAIRAGGVTDRTILNTTTLNQDPNPGTQWDEANIGVYSVALGENVRASASGAVALGYDTIAAQQSSFAVGEGNTASGAASVAMGFHAHTNARQGSFVFGDRSTPDVLRAGVNHSANWRVSGGFRIFTSSNLSTGVTIQSGVSVSNWGQSSAVISTSTGAFLSTGGVWTNASSRDLKRDFSLVDGRSVLRKLVSMPIQTWGYKAEGKDIRHIGPMSQDFQKLFGFGSDDKSIGTVDADGVALAAIQGLNEELKDRDKKIAEQGIKLTALEKQLQDQQKAIEALRSLVCAEKPDSAVCRRQE